jgi:pyruvate formate lyase activating enzyme
MHEALFYRKEGEKVQCLLCPHFCRISEGNSGICGVRLVQDGHLHAANYGVLAAVHLDPIEKKPLYHFYPGQLILSLGTYGCNLSCSFCQNWALARGSVNSESERAKPDDILALLEKEGGPEKALGVAYTYNEPLIWYEFVSDTARLLQKHGYKNVLVTNGFINEKPLEDLLPYIDAMNIDVKGFSDHFYQNYCHGQREPVIRTVEKAVKNCHVEVTCLLIPGLNDHPAEQEALARWLSDLDPDLVLHYSRYFPCYKLDLPPTEKVVMQQSLDLARKYLRYVYLGNIEIPGASDTVCPHCGNLLVARSGYRVKVVGLLGNICNNCGNQISIVLPEDLDKI